MNTNPKARKVIALAVICFLVGFVAYSVFFGPQAVDAYRCLDRGGEWDKVKNRCRKNSDSKESPPEIAKEDTAQMGLIKSGHDFYRNLVCLDGSPAKFVAVGTSTSETGEMVDTYAIECRDGTRGSYTWGKNMQPTEPPKGFKFKSR